MLYKANMKHVKLNRPIHVAWTCRISLCSLKMLFISRYQWEWVTVWCTMVSIYFGLLLPYSMLYSLIALPLSLLVCIWRAFFPFQIDGVLSQNQDNIIQHKWTGQLQDSYIIMENIVVESGALLFLWSFFMKNVYHLNFFTNYLKLNICFSVYQETLGLLEFLIKHIHYNTAIVGGSAVLQYVYFYRPQAR